jgi:ascorbate-specific PTS system EIIC-type component UlaA
MNKWQALSSSVIAICVAVVAVFIILALVQAAQQNEHTKQVCITQGFDWHSDNHGGYCKKGN